MWDRSVSFVVLDGCCSCCQQREKSEQIAKTMESVDKQRHHAEQLLYSMIPQPTAIRLKNGEDPINTWEVISAVVIMHDNLMTILGRF